MWESGGLDLKILSESCSSVNYGSLLKAKFEILFSNIQMYGLKDEFCFWVFGWLYQAFFSIKMA